MTLLNSIGNISRKPFVPPAMVIYNHKNASLGQSAAARLSFLIQLITSAIAIPLILVVGLLTAGYRTCKGEGKAAFKELAHHLKWHLIVGAPASLFGIFAPLKASNTVASELTQCFIRSEIPSGVSTQERERIIERLESEL